jgi:hypothetical protein
MVLAAPGRNQVRLAALTRAVVSGTTDIPRSEGELRVAAACG